MFIMQFSDITNFAIYLQIQWSHEIQREKVAYSSYSVALDVILIITSLFKRLWYVLEWRAA